MATFPSLQIEKKMIIPHFHRTRNEDNFILAKRGIILSCSSHFLRNNFRQTKWSPYLPLKNSAYYLHAFLSLRREVLVAPNFPSFPFKTYHNNLAKQLNFLSWKKHLLRHCLFVSETNEESEPSLNEKFSRDGDSILFLFQKKGHSLLIFDYLENLRCSHHLNP